MQPVRVDIIAYAPTAFFHCQHCEIAFGQLGIGRRMRQSEADEALPLDLQLEYIDLSDWVHALHQRAGGHVDIHVHDAASIAGVWRSLLHGVRSYPAVIVRGETTRKVSVGSDYRQLDPVIDQLVANKGGAS